MRVKIEPCYILHRKKYSENKYIIDLFSKNHGRIRTISRAIGKAKTGLTQPFTAVYCSWQQKSSLATLVDIEHRDITLEITGQALLCAFYLNELILKAVPENEAYTKLFIQYEEVLIALSSTKNIEVLLRLFEKNLLEQIGYGIPLDNINAHQYDWYEYHHEHGFIAQNEFKPYYFSAQTLVNLKQNKISSIESLRECKTLMRQALAAICSQQQLKSKALFQ